MVGNLQDTPLHHCRDEDRFRAPVNRFTISYNFIYIRLYPDPDWYYTIAITKSH